MKTTIVENKIWVKCPYDFKLPKRFRNLNGDFKSGIWEFDYDEDVYEGVRAILTEIFGWDGVGDTQTVKIATTEAHSIYRLPITLAGFELSVARGRDSGAKCGEDVILLKGKITSGGSVKNWTSNISSDAVVKIKNFPKNFKLPKGFEYVDDETKTNQSPNDEKSELIALIAEKESELINLKKKLSEL